MLKYSIAALALVAGSSFAIADPNNGGPAGGGAGGPAMQRSDGAGMPGGGANATKKGEGGPAMKGGDAGPSRDSSSGAMKGDRSSASENRSDSTKKNAASDDKSGKANRQQSADDHRNANDRDRQAVDNDRNSNRADRSDKMGDQAKDRSHADKAATGASEGTEGKARPKGSLTSISTEQKTRVRAAFGGHRVAPARDIGVAVSVGVVVPRSVHFYPLPADIVTIVPDYSGYEYFMIDESHVAIVDPDTLEVVDIIVVA